ncbi:MAG: C10 family peptidase [Bacteroidaceae bacterium]|nr:C10 family peptidase [Bacteroidaceae bacterium]
MLKKLTLIFSALMLSASMMADPIDVERAKVLAAQFMPTAGSQPQMVKRAVRQSTSGRRLAPAYKTAAPYYIFSRGENQGFVIVSGDDALPEVLGYTETGDFDEDNMSPFLQWYLSHYGRMIEDAQEKQLPRRAPEVTAEERVDIAPLVTTHWDQGWPYNNLCPDLKNGNGKALTGCVATATAQVLYYWHKDLTNVTLAATSSYVAGDEAKETRAFPAGTQIKWDLMRAKYGTEPEEYRTAIATLMAVVGGGAGLTYGSSTGGYPRNCINVFKNIFGMNGGAQKYKDSGGSDNFSDEIWATMLYNDLLNKSPILYAGCMEYKDDKGEVKTEGHAVVVDGYQAKTGFFHFNMGWSGQSDGYFTVARHQSPSWGFNDSYQEAVLGVSPRKPNLKAEFVIRPKVYVNRMNTFTIEVVNNGTLDYSGFYLFANTTGNKPGTLAEAKDKDLETVVSNDGTAVRLKLQAKPATASKWYYFVTDKNLNVLAQYEVNTETPPNDLWLNQLTLWGSEDKETHNGENYQVVYNNRTTVEVEIENRSSVGFEGSPRMAIYESTDDGKTFNYIGYKYNKVTINPKGTGRVEISVTSTSNCPISEGNLYYAELLDTIPSLHTDDVLHKPSAEAAKVHFVLRGGDLDAVDFVDGCLKLKGKWDASKFLTITKKTAYKGATSFDLTEVTNIGYIPLLASNPNALYYVSSDSEATGQNIIKDGACLQLVLRPGYDFVPKADFLAAHATMTIDMPACRWGLITVPCRLNFPNGIFAREIESHTSSGINNRTKDVRVLEEGHTYLIMTSSTKRQTLQSSLATVMLKVPATPVANTDPAVVGTYVATQTPQGAMLPNDADPQYFTPVDEGTPVEAFRGYFLASNVTNEFRAYSSIAADPSFLNLAYAIQAAYQAIDEHQDYANSDSTRALYAEIDSAEIIFTQRPTAMQEVRTRLKQLENKTQSYLASAPNPYELIDYTSMILNPSFESGTNGWTTEGVVKKNSDLTMKSVGSEGTAFLYNCKADSTSSPLSQVVKDLPKGYYRLTAMLGSTEGHDITLYAGDSTVTVKASPLGVHYLVEARIDDIFVESGQLEIGVRPGFFYKADDFRLTLTARPASALPEDVNRDGAVDTQDVLKIYEYIQNSTAPATSPAEDVNSDRAVDTQDVLKVYEYIQTH